VQNAGHLHRDVSSTHHGHLVSMEAWAGDEKISWLVVSTPLKNLKVQLG
jgi:hypothetical protein